MINLALEVNSSFRKIYRVPSFKLPCLDGITLILSEITKYLDVILDSSFSGKSYRKALFDFYMYKKTFGNDETTLDL